MFGTHPLWNSLRIAAVWLSISWGAVRAEETTAKQPEQHPLVPAIEMARGALAKVDALADYEGTLTKRELINGALTTQMMQVRVREKPFAVYLKYAAPNAGREVLFDSSQDPAQLLVHEGSGIKSLAGTVTLPVNDPQVMAEARHPVTDLGLRRLAQLVIQQWEYESKYGEIDVQYYPDAKMGKIPCEVLSVTHPKPRRQFKYHRTLLFIEKPSGLPLRVQNYGFPQQAGIDPPLVEDYAYTGLKTNVGLKPLDFSRTNPDYRFQ
jgi:hypothetical protein